MSWVPIKHDHVMVRSLLEGTIIDATGPGETNESLLCKHVHLADEARVQAVRLVPMHVVDWRESTGRRCGIGHMYQVVKGSKGYPS